MLEKEITAASGRRLGSPRPSDPLQQPRLLEPPPAHGEDEPSGIHAPGPPVAVPPLARLGLDGFDQQREVATYVNLASTLFLRCCFTHRSSEYSSRSAAAEALH